MTTWNIIQADITTLAVDAIVSAANSSFKQAALNVYKFIACFGIRG